MDSTNASLLLRIRDREDQHSWKEFHKIYAPMIIGFAMTRGLTRDDAEDLCGQCLQAVVSQIDTFEYSKSRGGFKAWLRTLVSRRIVDQFRKRRPQQADTGRLRDLEDSGQSPEAVWDRQWDLRHLEYCMEQVKDRVADEKYHAFYLLVIGQCSVSDVCDKLEMNPNQVYKAKSNIQKLIRAEMVRIGYDLH